MDEYTSWLLRIAGGCCHAAHSQRSTEQEGGWIRIPAGPFLMGEERPVYLDGYLLGKYPVTNAAYDEFVAAGGYEQEEFWLEAKEDKDSQGGKMSGKAHARRLARYGHPFNLPDHPVVGVTWYEATAYCRWLTWRASCSDFEEKIGLPEHNANWRARYTISLPSEAQWEKAARGGALNRPWPWGDLWAGTKGRACNCGGVFGYTTPVGYFSPQGDSYHGCADMAGNVCEWTQSLYKPYPYQADDGREDPEAIGKRVVRGGSFGANERSARCAFRYWGAPGLWSYCVGFRCVMAPLAEGGGFL